MQATLARPRFGDGALGHFPEPAEAPKDGRLASTVVARQQERPPLVKPECEPLDELVARRRDDLNVPELDETVSLRPARLFGAREAEALDLGRVDVEMVEK